MLELYHNVNSVCAQKVRIALKEKGLEAKEHLLKLRGDQNDPAYMKLNPNGVVPTLVHDGKAVIESSLIDALAQHQKMISWMVEDLKQGPYLAGDAFSNADAAVIPYILRLELLKLGEMYARYPAVADWWARMRERPSVKTTILERMEEADWAPFQNLSPDPWPKVQTLLKAA